MSFDFTEENALERRRNGFFDPQVQTIVVWGRRLFKLRPFRCDPRSKSFKELRVIFVAICRLFSHIRSGRIKSTSVILHRYSSVDPEVDKISAFWHLNFGLGFNEFVTRRVVF